MAQGKLASSSSFWYPTTWDQGHCLPLLRDVLLVQIASAGLHVSLLILIPHFAKMKSNIFD